MCTKSPVIGFIIDILYPEMIDAWLCHNANFSTHFWETWLKLYPGTLLAYIADLPIRLGSVMLRLLVSKVKGQQLNIRLIWLRFCLQAFFITSTYFCVLAVRIEQKEFRYIIGLSYMLSHNVRPISFLHLVAFVHNIVAWIGIGIRLLVLMRLSKRPSMIWCGLNTTASSALRLLSRFAAL